MQPAPWFFAGLLFVALPAVAQAVNAVDISVPPAHRRTCSIATLDAAGEAEVAFEAISAAEHDKWGPHVVPTVKAST